jgi:hypothetical protein
MFNAITGLNGSGKSNILDSICFVLGISRLEQVVVVPSLLTNRVFKFSSRSLKLRGVLLRTGARGVPAGAHLQAGPGRRYQSNSHNSFQQQGQEG